MSVKEKIKTKLVNKSGRDIMLQEGNAGVYRPIVTLPNDGQYMISSDPNATYRDYIILTLPDESPLESSVSTDDCLDYVEIRVKPRTNATDTYILEKIPRNRDSRNLLQKLKDKVSLLFSRPQSAGSNAVQPATPGAQNNAGAQKDVVAQNNMGAQNNAGAQKNVVAHNNVGALSIAV